MQRIPIYFPKKDPFVFFNFPGRWELISNPYKVYDTTFMIYTLLEYIEMVFCTDSETIEKHKLLHNKNCFNDASY